MPCYRNILGSGIGRECKSIFTVGVDIAAVILVIEKLLVCLYFWGNPWNRGSSKSDTDLPYLQQKTNKK